MDFDPNRPASEPRGAATVILLREGPAGAEVFLLRRHRGASFMAQAFVFPGGIAAPGEAAAQTAARELFEEAGVLLCAQWLSPKLRAELRARLAAQEVPREEEGAAFAALLDEAGLTLDAAQLLPFAHWITPSAEKRRYSAQFFLAALPQGQVPSFDATETVDELWVTPREALRRAAELRLPPPQLRCLAELAAASQAGLEAALELGRARGAHLRPPIVPRYADAPELSAGFMLLCPWDPDYERLGRGAGEAFPAGHPLGGGASRFALEGEGVWRAFEA